VEVAFTLTHVAGRSTCQRERHKMHLVYDSLAACQEPVAAWQQHIDVPLLYTSSCQANQALQCCTSSFDRSPRAINALSKRALGVPIKVWNEAIDSMHSTIRPTNKPFGTRKPSSQLTASDLAWPPQPRPPSSRRLRYQCLISPWPRYPRNLRRYPRSSKSH
jgi:hypothetical protein